MRFAVRIIVFALTLSVTCLIASAQDLGSANKLFGSGTASKKKTPLAKKTVAKPVVAKKKAPQPKVDAKKPTGASRGITTPTGKKITKETRSSSTAAKTTKPTAEPTATAKTRSTKKAPANAEKPTASKVDTMVKTETVPAKTSPADEARFEEFIEQGNSARDGRDYAAAESAYRKARGIKARDARAIYGLGNIYSDQQRWEEAENAYRTALQLDPASASTRIALSYVLIQPIAVADLGERYEEAEKLASKASELSPRSPLAFDQLGVAMELRGQVGSETENAYRKAIQLDPTFAPPYAHLGRLLRRRGQKEASAEAYRQAVERSTDVGTMVLVAEVMQSEQRYSDSEPLLRQAVAADPHNPSALIMLGKALTVSGEFKDAESVLQRAVNSSSNSYMANSLLASLYARQGAYELAENALLQALRVLPSYENKQLAQSFIQVAQGYVKVGKTKQAERAYAQAAKLDPDGTALSSRFGPR
jgi:Flp pilus assembly protein TadD